MNDREIFKAMERFQDGIKMLAYSAWRVLPLIEDTVRSRDRQPDGASSREGRVLKQMEQLAPPFREVLHGLDDLCEELGVGRFFTDRDKTTTGDESSSCPSQSCDQKTGAEPARRPSPFDDKTPESEGPPWLRELEGTARNSVPAGEPKTGQGCKKPLRIDWGRFKKCNDPVVAERIIEVEMRLRGEQQDSRFRLEATRSAYRNSGTYEVAIYRQEILSGMPPEQNPLVPDGPLEELRVWAEYDVIWSDHGTAEKALEQVLGFLEMRCE